MKKIFIPVDPPNNLADRLFRELRRINNTIKTLNTLEGYDSERAVESLEAAARVLRGDLLASIYAPIIETEEVENGEERK